MIKVSVCCITYNHEKFITQAIEGLLMQKTDFPIEILIHDDASKDATIKILQKYAKKHPNLIKLYLEKENQYFKDKKIFPLIFEHAKGKYIALCEGDDYWTDPYKLQKQIDFLEKNTEYSICSHNVIVRDETGVQIKEHEWLGKDYRQASALEDILKYGSGGATCSLVFRRSAFADYPSWTKPIKGGDWLLQILCCMKGKMRYFPEVLGVYRRHNSGMSVAINDSEKDIGLYKDYGIKACYVINKQFEYKYNVQISYNLANYFYPNLISIYMHNGNIKAARNYINMILNIPFDISLLPIRKIFKYYLMLIPINKICTNLYKIL